MALLAPAAPAETFQFTYTGAFNNTDALNLLGAPTTDFSGTTPFTATALFDDTSPNLAAPVGIPGFVAYSPTSAALTVAGQTYNIATYNQNPTQGVTVAVFDGTTQLGPPGHYAVGLLQNPLADGAGFIGDFVTSTPTFNAAKLVPTDFTGYFGVGYRVRPKHPQYSNAHGGPDPTQRHVRQSVPAHAGQLRRGLHAGRDSAEHGPARRRPGNVPCGIFAVELGILAIFRRQRA